MNAKAALVAVALVAAPLTMFAASSVDDAVDDAASPDAENGARDADKGTVPDLTRERLQEHRISYEVPADGWTAYRLNLTEDLWDTDDWSADGGRAELTLVVALEPDPEATPYLQLGIYREGQPRSMVIPLAFPRGEPLTETLEMQIECSSGCPATPGGQLAFVTGAMDGAASMHLGIPQDAQGADAATLDAIEARPALDRGPLPKGDAGMAGTFLRGTGPAGETREMETGRIHVEEDHEVQEDPLEAVRELSIEVDETIEPRGTAQMVAALSDRAGVQSWSLEAQLGEHAVDGMGAQAANPVRGVGDPPVAYLSTQPDADRAFLSLDQTFTGVRGEGTTHIVTWGWTSANLTELFGWPHEDVAVASGISTPEDPTLCAQAGLEACLSLPVAG